MIIAFASRTGPPSLVADNHAMSAQALRGLSCRWRTLVILGIVTILLLDGCGGGGSQQPPVNSNPPVTPTISVLSPSCGPAGEQFNDVNNQLTVIGLNFEASSVVRWNGSDRPTTLDPNTQNMILTAQISTSDIAAAGTAAVTVFNPGPNGGSSNSLTFTITAGAVDPQSIAVDPAGKFAYVASQGCDGGFGGYVSMYTINPTTGALASIGPPVPSGDDFTDSVTVDPFGKFAYVTSSGDGENSDGSVSTYTINPTTGALTSTSGIIGTAINGTPGFFNSMAFDPSGKFAYAADGGSFVDGAFVGSSSVSMFTIDSTTGVMTSIIGIIAAGTSPDSVAVDPAGKFVYVANHGSNDVSMYTIDASTGALASIGMIAAGASPDSVAVDPAGKFAYVANSGSSDVSMYTINATTGALTSIGTISAGVTPMSVVVDPSGKFAYAVNLTSSDVSMYTINATTGALTSIGTIAAGMSPTSIAVHPSGKFAYVTNSVSNDVSIYSIDGDTGALTLIGTIGT
jgi:YVTN family beta-propeller protein